jgi:glycosyltransferase involved in cell wall biosynthesis
MRVLIVCPYLHRYGGVANYFTAIKKYLDIKVDFLEIGGLRQNETLLYKFRNLYHDKTKLHLLIKSNIDKYDLVHINPSLIYGSLLRDGLLLRTASRFGKKTIVFFRGWRKGFECHLERWFFKVFFSTYNKANSFIVLGSDFKDKLRSWGFKQPIYLETTTVNDELLKDFSLHEKINRIYKNSAIQLLHIARIDNIRKGIIESLDALALLSPKYPKLTLIVGGDGSFLKKAQEHANRIGIKERVSFLGHIQGEKKKKVLMQSDVFLFPTYANEGMPNSVLEAMSFGIPLITRPVGGLKDILVDGKHGFITDSTDSSIIAALIERMILDINLRKEMCRLNNEFAIERFLASKVAKRLEKIYEKTLYGERYAGLNRSLNS